MQTTKSILQLFLELLSKAEAITAADSPLLSSWSQDEVTGDPENQVLHANWESEGLDYSVTFTEAGLAEGSFDQETGEFNCVDHEGEPATIKLYRLTPLMPN